ncbi:class I SAM-dependent methyltransferase [Azohydromonas aeria]|uniref:class I SAM-dependent methyltransferase n=1 Tax=Azohydromonas aeria TaxID=2590212 RepID=UPI0012F85BBD|nr:methyltransferase domain-containing protein [Azohydromonas aeria]
MNNTSTLEIDARPFTSGDAARPSKKHQPLRLLVVMASYGDKNLHLLRRQIACYQQMSFDVDIVVVSNNEKDLGPGVETKVGLPSRNPWSLPFAHKQIFLERADRYDVFAYSEDDIGVTEFNILAFLEVNAHLHADEVAGFIRYEVDSNGERSFPDVFGQFHWESTSAQQRGPHTIAQFTNEHAAFYLLTQQQLRTAIASGGFLKAPYEGEYDMLCTAATDPYTSCGLRKVVCISSLDDFSVHHLSNKYVGVMGAGHAVVQQQIDALLQIGRRAKDGSNLFKLLPRLRLADWGKSYYEPVNTHVLEVVKSNKASVLSIGSGWGATERALADRGVAVTALPLDPVIGSLMSDSGVEIIEGSMEHCFEVLANRSFDYVIIGNLLHLIPDPKTTLQRAAHLLRKGGTVVIYGPNFDSVRIKLKQALGRLGHQRFSHLARLGLFEVSPFFVKRALRSSGLSRFLVHWVAESSRSAWASRMGVLGADGWYMEAVQEAG